MGEANGGKGTSVPEFVDIPESHTFLEIKLYLVECPDGEHQGKLHPTGQLQFYNSRLEALGVDELTIAECGMIHQMAGKVLQQAINRAGMSRAIFNGLFGSILGGKDDESSEQHNEQGSGSGEQSASSASGHD